MFTYFFQRDFSIAISRLILMSFVAVLLFAGGCGEDDNPIVDDHNLEAETGTHADADGFVLEVDEIEIYRQFQGEQIGDLTVGVGEEIEVHVAFLDASGAETHVGEGETFSLSLTDYDAGIISIHLSEEEDAHAEEEHGEEEWRFEVIGLKASTTQITCQLLHGDHPDFTAALPIPVTVE